MIILKLQNKAKELIILTFYLKFSEQMKKLVIVLRSKNNHKKITIILKIEKN